MRRKFRLILQGSDLHGAIKSWRAAMFGMGEAAGMAMASLENLASALRQGGSWSAYGVRMSDDPSDENEAVRMAHSASRARGPEFTHEYVDEIHHWQGGRR